MLKSRHAKAGPPWLFEVCATVARTLRAKEKMLRRTAKTFEVRRELVGNRHYMLSACFRAGDDYGFRLGVDIAPSDIAHVSETKPRGDRETHENRHSFVATNASRSHELFVLFAGEVA